MSKQARLECRAIRYLRKRIYKRIDSTSSQFEIHFSYIDELIHFYALKRFSKLEDYSMNYILTSIDRDLNDYLACLERYGKE